jgi:hypothetical protein
VELNPVRRLLRPLSATPLHPQWLVLRGEAKNRRDIARRLTGKMLLIPGIIVINVLGKLLARLLPADDFMPLGYRLVCIKTS